MTRFILSQDGLTSAVCIDRVWNVRTRMNERKEFELVFDLLPLPGDVPSATKEWVVATRPSVPGIAQAFLQVMAVLNGAG